MPIHTFALTWQAWLAIIIVLAGAMVVFKISEIE